jgi:hypothetical protein
VTSGITKELAEFVAAKFGSPEQLDVFVLLYRNAERLWTPSEVAETLGMAPQSAEMRLFLLSSTGLLASSGSRDPEYQYVAEPTLDLFARLLVQAHARERGELYAIVDGARRVDPVRRFAEAFKLRKP